MTGHDSQIDPNLYIAAVLKMYLELPETPSRAGPHDRRTALDLYERRVTFLTVEAAMLLSSLRRLGRPPDYPPLTSIRSLAYFKPTIEELLANPIPDGYLDYLRRKVRILSGERRFKQCG
jgi:hypothetical protein